MTRTAYHHGALRSAILKQATKLLDGEGVDAVTIRAVARNAGVTHAAPVNHFENRSALLTSMATGFFLQLGRAIDARLKAAPVTPRQRIRVFADALLEFGLRYPNRYRLLWRRDVLIDGGELNAAMNAIYDKMIAELSQAGLARGKSAHTVAVAMWSMVHGYITLRIDGTFEARVDETSGEPRFRAMLDLLLPA